MVGRLRTFRTDAGLTQGELASRAGVSRQLVGAVEAGRHLPRVDAALALATALGVTAADLFGEPAAPVDILSGEPSLDGLAVRAGRVGDVVVTTPARVGPDGWDVADGIVDRGSVTALGRLAPGLVVAGCEPGLELLERLLREDGRGAVAVATSSESARAALAGGRSHAAVVHSPEGSDLRAPVGVVGIHLARWQVGLAAPVDAAGDWWRRALAGEVQVVQREHGAGVQRAFEAAAGGPVSGPRARSHLEAARRGIDAGLPAVTIEPAALAVGGRFHPLETHNAALWIDPVWVADRLVTDALDVITGAGFRRRLAAVGGYDLSGSGSRAA